MMSPVDVIHGIVQRIRLMHMSMVRRAVEAGARARWFKYRYVPFSTPDELRCRGTGEVRRFDVIHAADVAPNPLPLNVPTRDLLPGERGWWHYSFHDVPSRTSGQTAVWTIVNCRVVSYLRPENGDFWVGILTERDRALEMREFHFRKPHRQALLSSPKAIRLPRATWLLERVFNNYAHWLTAHLPKFLLMKEMGGLDEVLLPVERPPFVDESLRLFGIDPAAFRTFPVGTTVEVDELTLIESDRFRPELLRMPRERLPVVEETPARRRIFISRSRTRRRRLMNENAVWPLFERRGFERVFMEDYSFAEQVRMMQETDVLAAPHGAGLTNMMFCNEGTHVLEIADLSFPNPNFYATASALGHHYWLIEAEGLGDVHPLEKDLRVEPSAVEAVLAQMAPIVAT